MGESDKVGFEGHRRVRWLSDGGIWIMTNWETCSAVERRAGKLSGAWAFVGTRVPHSSLYENLGRGATIEEYLEWFPGVEETQVREVLEHEAKSLKVPVRS